MTQYNSRGDWGAAPPRGSLSHWDGGQPSGIAVHYVGGSGSIGLAAKDHSACLTLCKNLQNYAFSGGNGWTYSDIEYNLFACPHGYVIEGRGVDWQGAAQKGANSTHVSVCALANVGDLVIAGLATGLRDAVSLIEQHFNRGLPVVGHRDTAGNPTGTNCPGDYIEAWLPQAHQAPPPLPKPRIEEYEVSSSFKYGGYLHRMWIAKGASPKHKVGDLLHLFGPADAAHPQGATQNMHTDYTKGGLGPQDASYEPQFVVNDNGTIDGTTLDGSGAIVAWHWTGATWTVIPYFA